MEPSKGDPVHKEARNMRARTVLLCRGLVSGSCGLQGPGKGDVFGLLRREEVRSKTVEVS